MMNCFHVPRNTIIKTFKKILYTKLKAFHSSMKKIRHAVDEFDNCGIVVFAQEMEHPVTVSFDFYK